MKHNILLVSVITLLLPFSGHHFVSAHGDGVSYEETKDGYFVDIGRDVEFPIAQEQLRFDFLTYPENVEASTEDSFTDVWVRISQDRELFFSGGINRPIFGSTGFTYMFPKEGTYEMLARFQKEDETVVEVTYTLEVLPSIQEDGLNINLLFAGGAGFMFGLLTMFFIPRRKK